MLKSRTRNFIKSFNFARRGFRYCIKNERNMRIHIVASIFILAFSLVFELTSLEFAVLVISMMFVITSEMLNTAIETIVNLETSSYEHLARIAKDIAAGAVLVSSICSVIVGIALFFKPDKLMNKIHSVFVTPQLFFLFFVIIVIGLFFIIKGAVFPSIKTKPSRLNNFEE
jgi:diacylglycerol kinase (ATP)